MQPIYNQLQWTDDFVNKFWNYESNFPENYFSYQVGKELVHSLSSYFQDPQTVLDYGCGKGFLIKHLLERQLIVTGLDFSDKSVRDTNLSYGSDMNFRGAFTRNALISLNKKFDLITIVEVVEHLNDDHLKCLIDDIHMLLNKNGIAIITTPNNEDLSKQYVFCPKCDHVFHRWQHVRKWSDPELAHFLINNGFRVVDIFSTNFSTYNFSDELVKCHLGSANSAIMPHLVCVFTK